jgi:pSer/pThr/pTyr-binding forkhead associated (FHA) protein
VQFSAKFRFATGGSPVGSQRQGGTLRASHDTRDLTVARLRRGYLAGRFSTDTFALRVDRALNADSREELRGLTVDLPAPPPTRLARLRARLRPRTLRLPAAPELRQATLVLGRSRSCELVFADDTVSRRHAELTTADGRWILRDLGSSNGTWINGRRVVEAEVRSGDVVHLGGCALRL